MGVESKFYVLPDTSGYRPDPRNVSELVKALRAAGFICDPNSPAFVASAHQAGSLNSPADWEGFSWRLGRDEVAGSLSALELFLTDHRESDVLVRWPNKDLHLSGLKYPLSVSPGPDEVYHDIEMHLAADTVYHTSEIIDPFTDIRCSCGAAIQEFEPSGNDPFYSSRLPNHCPECHRQVNYATLPVTIRDGWTGVESKAVGGTAYRFAIVVDCGKCWPDGEADVVAEFLGVIERTVQIKTRVFRDFY